MYCSISCAGLAITACSDYHLEIASNKRALVLSRKQTSGAYKPKLHRASELSVLFTQKTQRNHLNKQLQSSTIIKLSVGFGLCNILYVDYITQQCAFII